MKKHTSEGDKSQPPHESGSDECFPPVGHGHDRFPTVEELNAFLGDEVSVAIDTDLAVIAYERHLMRIARHNARTVLWGHRGPLDLSSSNVFLEPISWTKTRSALFEPELPPGAAEAIIAALRSRRVDHRTLDKNARNRFISALQQAHQAGTYQQLAAIHAGSYRMHSMPSRGSGFVGTQRFLPWHRQYLLECENLLRSYEPSVRIPYWDYANDQVRPDWVWQPPDVDRGAPGGVDRIPEDCRSGRPGSLPDQQTMYGISQNSLVYTDFTFRLEGEAHNGVHVWCNGTISCPPTAAKDPIFWLLHANVDRIWNLWQMTHNGVPSLKALDWVLDPFGVPATDVDSVINLGYWYR